MLATARSCAGTSVTLSFRVPPQYFDNERDMSNELVKLGISTDGEIDELRSRLEAVVAASKTLGRWFICSERRDHYVTLTHYKPQQVVEYYNGIQRRSLFEAQVHILKRMGNPRAALTMIMEELNNVKKAIDFVSQTKDSDLWDVLLQINHRTKPSFVKGLLKHMGAARFSPSDGDAPCVRLFKQIPQSMEIDGLKDLTVSIIEEYIMERLRYQATVGIVKTDCVTLSQRLVRARKRGRHVASYRKYARSSSSKSKVRNRPPDSDGTPKSISVEFDGGIT